MAHVGEETGFSNREDQDVLTRFIDLLRRRGEHATSLAALFHLLQDDIRRIAHAARMSVRAGETLSTTALVSEVWFKFQRHLLPQFKDKQHFLSVAMHAMRQVLFDYAKQRQSLKRGGDMQIESVEQQIELSWDDIEVQNTLELHDALERLEAVRPRLAQVVYLRYFGGLSDAEIGELLDLEESTVRRDWLKARVWLHGKLR